MLLSVFQCFQNNQPCFPLLEWILHFSLWEVPATEAELNDHDSHFYNTHREGKVMGSFLQHPDTSKLSPSQNSLHWNYCVAPSSGKFSLGTDFSSRER